MSQQLDRAGTFRAQITDYLLKEPFRSGAVAVEITAKILAQWNPDASEEGEWESWEEYDTVAAMGLQWLIKSQEKGGELNGKTATALMECTGWDGDFDSLHNRTWQPTSCQIVCNEEKNSERVQYNAFPIAFVNAYDATPGGQREMAPDMVKQLQTQHGAALRALAGNAKRNAEPPKGKPSAPPSAKSEAPKENPANAALQEAASEGRALQRGPGDGVPF